MIIEMKVSQIRGGTLRTAEITSHYHVGCVGCGAQRQQELAVISQSRRAEMITGPSTRHLFPPQIAAGAPGTKLAVDHLGYRTTPSLLETLKSGMRVYDEMGKNIQHQAP